MGNDIFHLSVALFVLEPSLFRFAHNGIRDRMGEVLLQTGSEPQHFPLFPAAESDHLADSGRRVGQSSGLIKDNGVCLRYGLKEFSSLDIDVVVAALTHCGEDRNRHGQLQRAGEIDHKERKRPHCIPGQKPCCRSSAQRPGNKRIGQVCRTALCCGLEFLGFLDHIYDLVVPAAAESFLDADLQFALFQDCSRIDIGALALGHWKGFSRHGGLVDSSFTAQDMSVKRYDIPSADHDTVPGLNLIDSHEHFAMIRLFHPCLIHIQVHAARQVIDRFFVGPLFEKASDIQKEHDRIRRGILSSQKRYPDRCRIKDRDLHTSLPQAAQSFQDISGCFSQTV